MATASPGPALPGAWQPMAVGGQEWLGSQTQGEGLHFSQAHQGE